MNTTTLDRGALDKYMGHFELDPASEVHYINTIYQQVKVPEKILLDLCIDTRLVMDQRPLGLGMRELSEDTFKDLWGTTYKRSHKGDHFYCDVIAVPLTDCDRDEISRYPWPKATDLTAVDEVHCTARWLHENTDYGVVGQIAGPNIVQQAAINLRGLDQFLVDMVLEPKIAHLILDKVLEVQMGRWELFLNEAGPYLDFIQIPDDLASQRGLLISPELYRRIIKPHQKRYFDFVKGKTKAKLIYHCCGSYHKLIPDLIEIGVDVFTPIQPRAEGMDFASLKREYGKETCFWGTIDTQHLLPFGTQEEVWNECRRSIDELAPGGGFVFAPSHCIQWDVPLRNFLAMYRCARDYCR
ncbi:MAG: uroporphyrinogen decarboxylase family protein [Limnochordia bacterium]